jgi:hypothetical protein
MPAGNAHGPAPRALIEGVRERDAIGDETVEIRSLDFVVTQSVQGVESLIVGEQK